MATSTSPTQIPIFPSSDFDRTAAYYEMLGFIEETRYGMNYLIIKHPVGLELHFYGAGKVKSKTNDHAAYFRFASVGLIDSLHTIWEAAAVSSTFAAIAGKAGRVLAPMDTDYGLREFALLDPDGNLLRLGGTIERE